MNNTALRLSEASGRTVENRYQRLEAAYAENQEVKRDLVLLLGRGNLLPALPLRPLRLCGEKAVSETTGDAEFRGH